MAVRNKSNNRGNHNKNSSKRVNRKKRRRENININKIKSMKLAGMMIVILLAFTGLGGETLLYREREPE